MFKSTRRFKAMVCSLGRREILVHKKKGKKEGKKRERSGREGERQAGRQAG